MNCRAPGSWAIPAISLRKAKSGFPSAEPIKATDVLIRFAGGCPKWRGPPKHAAATTQIIYGSCGCVAYFLGQALDISHTYQLIKPIAVYPRRRSAPGHRTVCWGGHSRAASPNGWALTPQTADDKWRERRCRPTGPGGHRHPPKFRL